MAGPDIMTIWTVRSLSKKQRRARRQRFENKFSTESFTEQLQEQHKRDEDSERKHKIADLIEDIKALQLIGADAKDKKEELNRILKSKKSDDKH